LSRRDWIATPTERGGRTAQSKQRCRRTTRTQPFDDASITSCTSSPRAVRDPFGDGC
jgi:hypothetical protein